MSETVTGEALYQWRQWAIQTAQSNHIDLDEVDWFLQGFSTLSSLSLRLDAYRNRSDISLKASLAVLTGKWRQRINSRVPVQYLTGETPWRNFLLTVGSDVLIPRPETELMIDIAQQLAEQSSLAGQIKSGHWADLGTGSGAIALGLADCFPEATVCATDISEAALKVAQLNARRSHLNYRITFYQGSWLSPLLPLKGQLSGIVSNPPYIPSQLVTTLQPEVAHHEPRVALDGGSDGLDSIRTLVNDSARYLHSGGICLMELMAGQALAVVELFKQHGSYTHIAIHADLAGVQRFVSACKAL